MLSLGPRSIRNILPHGDGKRLVDEFYICDGEAYGKLIVTESLCQNHPIGGKLVFKGSDLIDMAAQVLGIYVYIKWWPHLAKKICYLRGCGEGKFFEPVCPGEEIITSVWVDKVFVKNWKDSSIVRGEQFSVTRGNIIKARFAYVSLAILRTDNGSI